MPLERGASLREPPWIGSLAEQDNAQHARQAMDAINARNLDAYVQLLDESFVMETELAATPRQGSDAVRQMLQS